MLSQTVGCDTRRIAAPSSANEASVGAPAPAEPAPDRDQDRAPASVEPDDQETLDQQIARLKSGNLAYNTPTKMSTGQTAHVVARIGSDKVSIGTLENGMSSDQNTQTATAATPVSTRMKMSLTSADFDITPLSTAEQFVTGDTPTTWEWQITPKHSGNLSLHLAAVVELNNLSRDYTTVDRAIAVAVNPVNAVESFFQANTVWVLGIIGAAIVSIWTWLKKRKKPKAPGWDTP